jgi:hypothetical protein
MKSQGHEMLSDKCPIEKRNFAPALAKTAKPKSGYGLQLRKAEG